MTSPRTLTLLPGQVALGERGDRLETLLGSCVAVVLTDPRRTVGAMCHIVHAGHGDVRCQGDTAFADAAIDRMARLLGTRGIVAGLCEAYVHGGGNMFPALEHPLSIGEDNVAQVLRRLQAMGVRLLGQDVGGTVYRRLRWIVGPGAPEAVAMEIEGST